MEIAKKIGVFIIVFIFFYGMFSNQVATRINKTEQRFQIERWIWSALFALATVLIMP